jgi:hypothetical protein
LEDQTQEEISKNSNTLFYALPENCNHKEYCLIKKCKEDCQIAKFYDRYGEEYNYFGI